MPYDCSEHEMYGEEEPCQLCLQEIEVRKIEAAAPRTVEKTVRIHEPGPCPECQQRTLNEHRQRVSLLLAVLFAVAATVAGNLLKLQDPVKSLVYVPSAVIALLGIMVPLRAHSVER